jgi:hypothetical protein
MSTVLTDAGRDILSLGVGAIGGLPTVEMLGFGGAISE